MSKEWFVYKNSQQQGPYTREQILEQFFSGAIKPSDQIWGSEMDDWTRADQVHELSLDTKVLSAGNSKPPPLPLEPSPQPGIDPSPQKSKGGLVALIIILL